MRSHTTIIMVCLLTAAGLGCNQSSPNSPGRGARIDPPIQQEVKAVSRPSVAPPPFKVAHQSALSASLVVKEDANDDEVAAVLWELRDAAHAHALDKMKISQKAVDARDPNVAFYVYRGAKCANEKYIEGKPPCGPSDHSAGSYTFGSYKKKDWDSGQIITADGKAKQLWDPNTEYVAPR